MGETDKQSDETADGAEHAEHGEHAEQSDGDSSVSNLQLEVNEEIQLDDGEDFTLQTLSEAYAEVMRSEDSDHEDEDEASEDPEDDEVQAASSATPDQDDDAACPISPESIVESILFVGAPSDVKLTSRKIAAVLRDVSPKEVTQIVKKLNAGYVERNAAWRIATDKGNCQMVLHESLESFRDEFFGRNRQFKLNQSSIDVLAVVAYHQPATVQEIDKVRGKKSSSILNQLVKRQLLVKEQSDDSPPKKQYRTTDRFLDLFGLTEIEDLPQSHEVGDIEEFVD